MALARDYDVNPAGYELRHAEVRNSDMLALSLARAAISVAIAGGRPSTALSR
jgi:hypothetical protein